MNCSSCHPWLEFAPIQDTWTKQSSLNPTSWQPYPELEPSYSEKPSKKPSVQKEKYAIRTCNKSPYKEPYQYSLNVCNKSIQGPPATNGYRFSDQQPPNKEKYECGDCVTFRYSSLNKTWKPQKSYTL